MSFKSIFIKKYPYINLIIAIFRILIKGNPYIRTQNKGQKIIEDIENVFVSILYKVKSGIQWNLLPTSAFGKFSSSTAFNYFSIWVNNGLWKELWIRFLKIYSNKVGIRWFRQLIDSTKIKAIKGGEHIGTNSTDRGRNGSKLHTLTDENGITLSVILTGANVHDCKLVQSLIENIVIKRPKRKRNSLLLADKGYDSKNVRQYLLNNGYTPIIPRNKRNKKQNLDQLIMTDYEEEQYKHRIKIENSYAHLKNNKSLIHRYERYGDNFLSISYIAFTFNIASKLN